LPSDCLHFAYRQELPGSLGINESRGKKCAFGRNSVGLTGAHGKIER
jgi:hypothetical protein